MMQGISVREAQALGFRVTIELPSAWLQGTVGDKSAEFNKSGKVDGAWPIAVHAVLSMCGL